MLTGLKAYWNVLVLGKMPVVVYAAGRVGSVAMLNALRRAGVFSFKVEFFDHTISASSRFCSRHVLRSQLPAKFIVLVRDPVEVLCSLYFSKVVRGHVSNAAEALRKEDVATLVDLFQVEVAEGDYVPTYVRWFETEFAPHLGFSMFAKPFDWNSKFTRFKEGRFDVLVLRTDMLDAEKERQVEAFLEIDRFKLRRENEKSASAYAALYSAFKAELKLIPSALDMIYTSAYAQHFFSPGEISELRRRWNQQ